VGSQSDFFVGGDSRFISLYYNITPNAASSIFLLFSSQLLGCVSLAYSFLRSSLKLQTTAMGSVV
jgi:hypothetical protein